MKLKTFVIPPLITALVSFITALPVEGQRRGEAIQEEPESETLEASEKITSRWYGTAPFCAGSSDDCQEHGLHFWLNNNHGDGAGCTTGHKVLCVSVAKSEFDTVYWVGTAPFCGAKPEDCTDDGAEFIAYGTSGDGHSCQSGKKVLCARK